MTCFFGAEGGIFLSLRKQSTGLFAAEAAAPGGSAAIGIRFKSLPMKKGRPSRWDDLSFCHAVPL